jgi:pre-mRNA-splicing factor 18
MELLQAEINRKRKISSALIDELNPNQKGQLGTASGGSGHTHTRTRYYRQGDLKNLEEKKLRENQYKKDQEKLQQIQKNYQIQEAENARVEEETASDKAKIFENLLKLDMKSIQNRLRNLMQPVTLFGESNEERIHRLCTVMSDEGEGDDYRLAASYSTNGNQKTKEKRNRNGEEEDDMYEDDEGSGQLNDQLKDENKSNSKDDNEEGDDAEHQQEGRQSSFKKGEIATHYSTTPGLTNQKIIYKYFRNLLKQWEWDLDDRDDMTKRTAKGKMETRTQKQCKDYIRPLFKLCKNDEIPWDISDKLVKVSVLYSRV